VVDETLESSSLVRAELRQIIALDDVAVGLERPHGTSEIDDVLDRCGVGDQVLYSRCFSCSTGSSVSITPWPPKFNHLAKPLYVSLCSWLP